MWSTDVARWAKNNMKLHMGERGGYRFTATCTPLRAHLVKKSGRTGSPVYPDRWS